MGRHGLVPITQRGTDRVPVRHWALRLLIPSSRVRHGVRGPIGVVRAAGELESAHGSKVDRTVEISLIQH
jgi:hypothetical protein